MCQPLKFFSGIGRVRKSLPCSHQLRMLPALAAQSPMLGTYRAAESISPPRDENITFSNSPCRRHNCPAIRPAQGSEMWLRGLGPQAPQNGDVYAYRQPEKGSEAI